MLLLLGGGAYASTRVHTPRTDRNARLREICDRGAQLHAARLLDEAVVVYARAQKEHARCATTAIPTLDRQQQARSDAIESARADRLIAARLSDDDAVQRRGKAYREYLQAFDLDVRSPGARSGMRALLHAQKRALDEAFDDRSCARARELLKAGLLFEARELSGVIQTSSTATECQAERDELVERRRAASVGASRADGLADAGNQRAAFTEYVQALKNDPSSSRALRGLRRLSPIEVPKQQSVGQVTWKSVGSAAADVGPALRAALLVVAVLLLVGWLLVTALRRRADRRGPRQAAPRSGGVRRAIDQRYQVTSSQTTLDIGERQALELIADTMRRPGLIRGRPADELIEANPRFLDTMPSESAERTVPAVVQDIVATAGGGDALARAWSAGSGIFVRRADELETRIIRGPDTRIEIRMPGGETVNASAADLGPAAPPGPNERLNAVAQLAAERARETLES